MRIDMTQLMTTFTIFQGETNTAMDSVSNHLSNGQYAEAADVMNTLTERMAKTSLAMRTILIKAGHIKGEA